MICYPDISHWILHRNWFRHSRSTDFDRTFGVVPLIILTKFQRRLLIKPVRNIQCKCIKNVKAFGDGGWDLGHNTEVTVRVSNE